MSNNLYNQKWDKFLKRIWPFRFIPFVDFVLAAGSLATGNMNEDSDFDVIVGVRQGRIFSARAFCFLSFEIFGWWARHPKNSKDKLCFNHFVTPKAYRLSPPYNEYWVNLYKSLVPVYGGSEVIQKFYDANIDWLGARRMYKGDEEHIYKKIGWVKKMLDSNNRTKEGLGDWLENILKSVQMRKIEKSLGKQSGYKPRIIFNDNELEFHPDTRRIDGFLNKN